MPAVVKKVIKKIGAAPFAPVIKRVGVGPTKLPPIEVAGGDTATPVVGGGGGHRLHLQVGQTLKTQTQFEMLRVDYGESTTVQAGETVEQARARLSASVLAGYQELLTEVQQTLVG